MSWIPPYEMTEEEYEELKPWFDELGKMFVEQGKKDNFNTWLEEANAENEHWSSLGDPCEDKVYLGDGVYVSSKLYTLEDKARAKAWYGMRNRKEK